MKRTLTKQHHQHESTVQKPGTISWEAMTDALFGLGEIPVQLDGQRLHLGGELWKRLGPTLQAPWLISFWTSGCLRIVPRTIWGEYQQRVLNRSLINDLDLLGLITQTAKQITIDGGKRWNLPTQLLQQAGINGTSCVLVFNTAWIEVWSKCAREERQAKLMKALHAKVEQTVL